MRPRIKELAVQAGIHPSNFEPDADIKVPLEKFAELIVRDCIEVITTYDLIPGHSAKWEDIYDIHARLLDDLGEELKEHFGIKE